LSSEQTTPDAASGGYIRLMAFFSMRPGEVTRALLAFTYLFLIIATYLLLKPIRNSLFISEFGAMKLPWVMLGIAVLAGAFAAVYIRLAKRMPTPRLVFWSLIFFASNVLIFWWLALGGMRWLYPLLYLWTGVFGVIGPMQVWTLSSEMFTTREARRLFGFVGAGGILGATAGGAIAGGLAPVIGTTHLLLVVLGLLLLAAGTVLVLARHRNVPKTVAADAEAPRNLTHSLGVIAGNGHLRLLAGLIFVSALATTSVDFQFSIIAERAIDQPDQLTAFFGNVYAGISLVAIGVQLLLTSRLMAAVGAGLLILLLPLSLATGSLALLFSGALWAGVFLKGSDGALKHSLDRSCRELMYLPVPSRIRAQAKSTIDTVMDRMGDGSAGALQLLITGGLGMGLVASLWCNFLLLLIWLYLALKLRFAYVAQLRSSLGQRFEKADELVVEGEADTTRTIELILESGTEEEKLGALEWASVNDLSIDDGLLLKLVHDKDSQAIRNAALGLLLCCDEGQIPPEMLEELEAEGQAALIAAIDLLVEPEAARLEERLEALLDRAGDTTRLSIVAFTLRRLGPEFEPFANRVFDELLAPEAPVHARLAAVRALALLPAGSKPLELLENALLDPDPSVAAAAADASYRHSRTDLLPRIVGLLGRPRVATEARRSLLQFGEATLPELRNVIADDGAPAAVRHQVPRLLGDIASPAAVAAVVDGLEDPDPGLVDHCIDALHGLVRRDPGSRPLSGRLLERKVFAQADKGEALASAEDGLREDPEASDGSLAWLADALENERHRTMERIFKLMALEYGVQDMSRSWLAIDGDEPRARANAIEFLDNTLPKPLMRRLLPLCGTAPREAPDSSRREILNGLAEGPDPWLAACALYAARESGYELEGEHGMDGTTTTVVERAIALRKVEAFRAVPIDQLAHIASAARESTYPAGEALFSEGETPQYLFVILSGRIGLRRDGKPFGEAGPGEALGMWALFDDNPRRATAMVTEDARVLELERDDFYEVLSEHVEITRSLVQDLVKRLLELTQLAGEGES
jgi:ATP/ADP translocase